MSTQDQRMGAYVASAMRATPKVAKAKTKAAKPAKVKPEGPAAPKVPKPTAQGLKSALPAEARKKLSRQPGSGRKMANGFRVYAALDQSQVKAALYSYSPAFHLMKRVLAYQYSFVAWGRRNYPKTFDEMPAAGRMNLVPKWAIQEASAYNTAVDTLAAEIYGIATAERVHAFDVVDEIYDAAFVGMSHRNINKMVRAGENKSLIAGVARKINFVKRLRPRLVRSHMPLLNEIGTTLSKVLPFAGAVPYTAFYGAKPWKTGRSQNVMGVEVVRIGYKIATAVDDKGTPTTEKEAEHDTAAFKAGRISGDNAAMYKAILARTPVGRVFLCQDPASKNLFLASDHARGRVWLDGDKNPFLLHLFSGDPNIVDGRLSLFVF